MPLKLTSPIIETFFLEKTDEKYGDGGDPTFVVVKQARTGEDAARDRVYSEVTRVFDTDVAMQLKQNWTMAELARREVFLTMVDCNIQKDNGKPLFKFSPDHQGLSMSEADFNETWAGPLAKK
jgi:hypothetical protein